MNGKFVTVYLTKQQLKKWSKIQNKSKFVQEAVDKVPDGSS